MGEQKLSFDLTVPYEHSLCMALAVRALPGACQSLPAVCYGSNAEMSHHLAMPQEATLAEHGTEFSVRQLRGKIAMFIAFSLWTSTCYNLVLL